MGFFGVMKFEIHRETKHGERIIVGRFFDSVLNRWVSKEFPTWEPSAVDAAITYCRQSFMALDM